MIFHSINPFTGKTLESYPAWTANQLEAVLVTLPEAQISWAATRLPQRAAIFRNAARILREGREGYARLISLEMGKLIGEARQEIDKCAWVCEFYAEQGAGFLADEAIATEATRSWVAYEPLGTILTIMPWNFPFWQVFRAAIPILLGGNTVLLKQAPNVTGCALAIEAIFHAVGVPPVAFRSLLIPVEQVSRLLADPNTQGVSLTGSVKAGREVARLAGANLKKAVLELGGSDPFIVLEDADLNWTVAQALASRFVNGGQSCIAAKRFIVLEAVADEFVERFRYAIEGLRTGDPLDESTGLAPLAREDLRETLQRQVAASIDSGALVVTGCKVVEGDGFFYRASLLDHVRPGMAAFDEEIFGPVAAITRVADEREAVRLANLSYYGLGGSVWTGDIQRGERIARQLQCGMAFVNAMVKSDPRLPCGGIKDSGFGRELSYHGVREFTQAKTYWINAGQPSR